MEGLSRPGKGYIGRGRVKQAREGLSRQGRVKWAGEGWGRVK